MYKPSLEDIHRLSEQGNLIPAYRELPADLETPVSVYLKLRGQGPSFLLESVERGEQVGRYSFLGANPQRALIADQRQVHLRHNGTSETLELNGRDPMDVLKETLGRYRAGTVPGPP